MIINGRSLIWAEPIKDMLGEKVQHNGVSHGLSEAGYDIRIKQEITFRKNMHFMHHLQPLGWYWKKGRFALASTLEEFQMPANLVGVVHDKSTWARQGLSVLNTVIEPGWKGFLTLELVYHGEGELLIPAGSGIAQVIFHDLQQPGYYGGKYQNQEDKPVPAKLI